ncbi:MAG: hypothetical protein HFH92_10255 [Lachnospiraceae bacterium]|uniref:DUF6707 family protein n=1 Tax=uncultured Acetatifactor sp. TaxID=1671927 RepID=UPI00263132B3|nr:DUF6707 family protein [uncultured Acetatifactor sp.]MCI8789474.1 hypothetical protein [Lachnospiraceae bacterium]
MKEWTKLQQQIKEFHKMLIPALKKVLEEYDKNPTHKKYNTVVKPSRQLIQKCSCKSPSNIRSLRDLTYWLYIFGDRNLALELCELALTADFSLEYEVDAFADMYGFEIRIARELFGESRRRNIPSHLLDYYFSKQVKRELKFPDILRKCLQITYASLLQNLQILSGLL